MVSSAIFVVLIYNYHQKYVKLQIIIYLFKKIKDT